MKMVFIHNLADVFGSIGVIISGFCIVWFGVYSVDGIVALLIAFYMIFQSIVTFPKIVNILMNAAPDNIDIEQVKKCILDIKDINKIGLQIKENFDAVYKIAEFIEHDYALLYIFELNNKVVGFIQAEEHYEITDIINIAVDKEYQNKGVGKMIIMSLISELNNQIPIGESFQLEASPTANNREFYTKCGLKYKPENQDGVYVWLKK